MISLRLGLKGYATEGTAHKRVAAEMGRSTDADGDGDVQPTSVVYLLHRIA